ncbi:MAG: hypothetical protein AB1489_39840 [Acidobacteriota bacterium]
MENLTFPVLMSSENTERNRRNSMNELPDGYKDKITTFIEVQLGLKDKLKLLLGFSIEVKLVTYCQNVPGKVCSESSARVYRERPLPPGWGVAEAIPISQKGPENER